MTYQRTSIYDGLPVEFLQAKLTAMQEALLDLQTGASIATASYAQGDGSRSVSYRPADIPRLTNSIIAVQTQIDRLNGIKVNRRPPLTPFF